MRGADRRPRATPSVFRTNSRDQLPVFQPREPPAVRAGRAGRYRSPVPWRRTAAVRALRLLLLVVLLPGLLLPGGIALRLCRCAPAEQGAASCCASARPSCCCTERAPARSGDPTLCDVTWCCCPQVAVPERAPAKVGGGEEPHEHPAAPAPDAPSLPRVAAAPATWPCKPIPSRPPPGARRNLPLLI